MFFSVKTVERTGIDYLFRIEKRTVSINVLVASGALAAPSKNHLISGIDFTIAVHLVTENICENKRLGVMY